MRDVSLRLVWFAIVATAFAYCAFLLAGSAITARAVDETRILVVRDVLQPGAHHLSGMVSVPSTCAQLVVRTEKIADTAYKLVFSTWEEPNIDCVIEDTPRAFRSVVFAPATGITFLATLDELPLPMVVLPVVQPSHSQ